METENTRKCTKSQAELAKQASSYMLEHMDKKITISEISERMHVSQTQLKNSYENCSKFAAAFRGEYGVSPSSYRKQRRVRNFPGKLQKAE